MINSATVDSGRNFRRENIWDDPIGYHHYLWTASLCISNEIVILKCTHPATSIKVAVLNSTYKIFFAGCISLLSCVTYNALG